MSFIKTPLGIVLGVFTAALLVLGIWKGQSVWDHYLANRYNQKTVSSEAHGDSAKVFHEEAAKIEATEVRPARAAFTKLKNSPEVKSNPVAVAVAGQADKVIEAQDKKDTAQQNENAQLRKEITDLKERGEKPKPRAIPYVDGLYSWSPMQNKSVPVVRVGVDYRVVSFANVKLELGYEPPPNYSEAKKQALINLGEDPNKPEVRLTVGGHIAFR